MPMIGKNDSVISTIQPVIPYYVRGLALGVPAYLIGVHFWTWVFMVPFYLGGQCDFRQLYTGGYMLRAGYAHRLYDLETQHKLEDSIVSPSQTVLPIDHPAYEELLFVPFSLFSYKVAFLGFLAINTMLLGVCYWLLKPWLSNLSKIFWWLPAVLFPAFLPVGAALIQGQDSVLLLTLLVMTAVLLSRGREELAGSVAAMGLFKFQITIPIVFLFWWWRRRHFVRGFALSTAGLSILSLCLVGITQAQAYGHMLLYMATSFPGHGYPLVINRMANIHGFVFGVFSGLLGPLGISFVSLFVSVSLFCSVANLCRCTSVFELFLVAICTSFAVSYHSFIHDMSVLLLPILIMLARFCYAEAEGAGLNRKLFRAAALLFVAPIGISYFGDHFYLVVLPLLALTSLMVVYCRRTSVALAAVGGAH